MNHKLYTFFLFAASIILSLSTTSCAFPKIFGFLDKDKDHAQERRNETHAPATYIDTLNRGQEVALSSSDLDTSIMSSSSISAGEQTAGYRIQCSATTDADAARTQKKQLESKTNMPVYIIHADPYYKVQVGDFIDRKSADQALKKIKAAGYNDAWVVSTTVFKSTR